MPQSTTTTLTAALVMDRAASLMNDTAKTVFTYAAQLPYLNMAIDELQEYFQLNNIPVTNASSAAVVVPIGTTQINPVTGAPPNDAPNYPFDLVEIQGLYERLSGSTDAFQQVAQTEFLSHLVITPDLSVISEFCWDDQRIKFAACLTEREIKIDYIRKIFVNARDENSVIDVINAGTFLYYRTASLCSLFIGENPSRATELNGFAVLAIDRATGISVKGKQFAVTRRRAFRSAFRNRGY